MQDKNPKQAHSRLFKKGCLVLTVFIFLVLCISNTEATAQTVVVRLLNGRTGKPIPNNRMVVVLLRAATKQSIDLTTNQEGDVQFESVGVKGFQVLSLFQVGCGEQVPGGPQPVYSVEEILKKGLITKNICGHLNTEPLRGKLLYFVRPAHWWELFKQ